MLEQRLVFHGIEATAALLFWLAVIASAAVCTFLLAHYERKLVSRRIGITLLSLRLLVLTLLLLTLLQPTFRWTRRTEIAGRIIVALDVSESMKTADPQASSGEKLRWARALGMVGNVRDAQRLDAWQTSFDNNNEPEWVAESESADPDRRQQLSTTRRDNLFGVFAEIDRLPRTEIARRLLEETASPLLRSLGEIGRVELRLFAGEAESIHFKSLHAIADGVPASLSPGKTNLEAALTTTAADSESTPIRGIVVLTDGRDTGPRDPVATATQLGQIDIPVFPIVLGSRARPRDVAIANIEHPDTVFRNDRPRISATVSTSGFSNERISVTLEPESGSPQTRSILANGNDVHIEFDLDPPPVGRHRFTLKTEVQPGETRDDNNEAAFALSVVDDTVRVLLIDGEPRWEFRYLDAALSRDERVDVSQVVFDQPYLGRLGRTFYARQLPSAGPNDPDASTPFSTYDIVIVGDVAANQMPESVWRSLDRYVAEDGGTLTIVAGKHRMPFGHTSPTLTQLLPVENLRVITSDDNTTSLPHQRGLRLRLTPDGLRESMLQFDVDRDENARIWSGLPGHLWAMVGRAKPATTVLADAFQPGIDDNLQHERDNAVIVHRHYGVGQVLWIGIDSTWRWRHRIGDAWHHRFWGQMGRWAAENKAAAGNEFVRFGPSRTELEAGEDLVISARWTPQFIDRHPTPDAKVRILRADDDSLVSTLDLVPADGRPLQHEAVTALGPGEYRLVLDVDGIPELNESIESTVFVNEPITIELSDISCHRELLNQIAAASGGKVFEPHEKDSIAAMFDSDTTATTAAEELELWDHWGILLTFFALMTTEWAVRKLNGLP